MVRRRYQKQLDRLRAMLWEMGTAVEQVMIRTDRALQTWDLEAAKAVVEGDDAIDEMERGIENACLHLITMQQPVAGDLREITAVFRMIADLERIADQAADISSCLLEMGEKPPVDDQLLRQMSSALLPMYRGMMKSYQNQDPKLARETLAYDDQIDSLFWEAVKVFDRRISASAGGCVYCVFIAKYLERMGDHITNVCEWILYRLDFHRRK